MKALSHNIQRFDSDKDIFETALIKISLFHHPYESFEPVVDFVADASNDPMY